MLCKLNAEAGQLRSGPDAGKSEGGGGRINLRHGLSKLQEAGEGQEAGAAVKWGCKKRNWVTGTPKQQSTEELGTEKELSANILWNIMT